MTSLTETHSQIERSSAEIKHNIRQVFSARVLQGIDFESSNMSEFDLVTSERLELIRSVLNRIIISYY